MGCLNSNKSFDHWFGNIHFSGKCNRSCYFCIGQFMQELEHFNNLDTFPLNGIDLFIEKCKQHNITEVALTGSNTDPLMYKHIKILKEKLNESMDLKCFRLTTNGALILRNLDLWNLFDFASITMCSFDETINQQIMGGPVIDLVNILKETTFPIRINIILSSKNVGHDLIKTIQKLEKIGIKSINLREPYGQPNMKEKLMQCLLSEKLIPIPKILGNEAFQLGSTQICYWDVHYTHVESVNLYANGRVSEDYPITRGHSEYGSVHGQEHFLFEGRKLPQWYK